MRDPTAMVMSETINGGRSYLGASPAPMKYASYLLIFSVFATSACFRTYSWTKEQSAEKFRNYNMEQASFELGCPSEKITVVGLSSNGSAFPGSTVGVTGCGKKTTFVGTSAGTWIKNSETQDAR